MAWRLASALLALAALAACSGASTTYMGDPYSDSSSRSPGSFGDAYGSPKLPPRYEGSTFSDLYGGTTARAALVPPLDPKRKITEQDCSKALSGDGGNLRCK